MQDKVSPTSTSTAASTTTIYPKFHNITTTSMYYTEVISSNSYTNNTIQTVSPQVFDTSLKEIEPIQIKCYDGFFLDNNVCKGEYPKF